MLARTSAFSPRWCRPDELRERVGSVKNTKKITSAMRLVAAAKVRRAQEAVLRSRPFSEKPARRILGELLQRLKMEALDIPLPRRARPKKVGLVVITAATAASAAATTRTPSRRPSSASRAQGAGASSPRHHGGAPPRPPRIRAM